MFYYGYFRNIDTRKDSKGQLFKVEIFTEYTGKFSPYPYEYNEQDEPLWPLDGEEITLTESPFTVEYENDSKNIYKPYKCSTAEVRFLYPTINVDFINTTGTNVMVALLKWKNEVVKSSDGTYYLNTITNEVLNQKTMGIFTGFIPSELDEFCYNVEWIGFSIPETLNIDFNNDTDVITLNCQDAFSALKYFKFKKKTDTNLIIFSSSIQSLIIEYLRKLGTYRNIYITDSLATNTLDIENELDKIHTQYMNYIDEDDEEMDLLSVIEEMLKTLSLTAIPFKNSLYIINYDAIYNGFTEYWAFSMNYEKDRKYFNLINNNNIYAGVGKIELDDRQVINKDSYSETGTSLSTDNIYKGVKVNVNDYKVGNLFDDIYDSIDKSTEEEVSFVINDAKNQYIYTGSLYDFNHYNPRTDIDKSMFIGYDYESDSYSMSQQGRHLEWSDDRRNDRALTLHDVQVYPGCCAFKYYKETVEDGDYYESSVDDEKIGFYFHSSSYPELPMTFRRYVVKSEPSQFPLKALSKFFLLNKNMFFEIKGNWTFFNRTFPLTTTSSTVEKKYCYVNAIVKLCGQHHNYYYLQDYEYTDDNGCIYTKYTWTNNEVLCKLRLDFRKGNNGFGNSVSNISRKFYDFNGSIIIPSPIVDDEELISYFEIDFERPIGINEYSCNSALLEDFNIRLFSTDYVNSLGKDNIDNTDSEYTETFNLNASTDNYETKLSVSTTHDKGDNNSRLFYNDSSNHYIIFDEIYNKGTCNIMKPEEHIINNIKRQYENPTVKIDVNMKYNLNIKPYSIFKWDKFNDKLFIVDNLGFDYEMNKCKVSLVEKKKHYNKIGISLNNIRNNYKRNNDLNVESNRFNKDKQQITNTHTISQLGTFSLENNSVKYTVNLHDDGGYIEFNLNIKSGELVASVPNDLSGVVPTISSGELIIRLGNMVYNLGKVMPTFKGNYDNATAYEKLDVVYYNNKSYVALGNTTGHYPTDTTYWQIIAG